MKPPLTFRIVKARRKDGLPGCRVRVKDGNNKLIFLTQVYKSKASARNAIALMQAHAASARVVDETAPKVRPRLAR